MRALPRLWAMCAWLLVTSPLYWTLTAACLYGAWRWSLSPEGTLLLFVGSATGSLLFSLVAEAGGALHERIRFARSAGSVLSAAAGAVTASALGWWALSALLFGWGR